MTVEAFGATPQGPYVLYVGKESELLDSLGGRDLEGPHAPVDRDRLLHFRLPRSDEGTLDLVATSVAAAEIVTDVQIADRAHLSKGVEVWSNHYPIA